MEQEISQHLKDKLKNIEKETEFFSREPKRPLYSRFAIWAAITLSVVCAYFVFTSDNKTVFFLLLVLAVLNFVIHLHQKQLFDMYSSAVEIIKYYKESDAGEI